MRDYLRVSVCLLWLGACSFTQTQTERLTPSRPISRIAADTVTGTAEGAWHTVQMPFEDLGFKEQPIPEKLQVIQKNPYNLPKETTCEEIRKELDELDRLLGPDVCTPENPTGLMPTRKGEYVEDGASAIRNQAVGIVDDYVGLPFRGIIRRLSGAERHAKEVVKAYQAGNLRRAFLKGIGASRGGRLP